MVQLQEITEDVAAKLKLAEATEKEGLPTTKTTLQNDTAAAAPAPTAAGPDLPPDLAINRNKTAEEILADLNKSPLFMTELEENDGIAALQALAYEGTPLENARDFKERGNECFRESKWSDARQFYDKGVPLLVAEDRRRARGEAPKLEPDIDGNMPPDPDTPAEIQAAHTVLEQLYTNRAACHLELRNFRACTLDCASALRLRPTNAKAWFRSARAMLALDKIAEAREACSGGLAADPANAAIQKLAKDVETRAAAVEARVRRDAERETRAKRKAWRLQAVMRGRGIRTRTTAQPPEMEDACVRLAPEDDGAEDYDAAAATLSFPTVLLYPLTLQSDFVKAFSETESLGDHLAYILPPPWDSGEKTSGQYQKAAAVDCYMETATGGLVKVGKKMALGKILVQAKIEVVDEVVRVFVVPRAEAEAWVADFKSKKAAERGEHQ